MSRSRAWSFAVSLVVLALLGVGGGLAWRAKRRAELAPVLGEKLARWHGLLDVELAPNLRLDLDQLDRDVAPVASEVHALGPSSTAEARTHARGAVATMGQRARDLRVAVDAAARLSKQKTADVSSVLHELAENGVAVSAADRQWVDSGFAVRADEDKLIAQVSAELVLLEGRLDELRATVEGR